MTKIELEMVVTAHTYSDFSTKAIMTAVDAYTEASNGAKPIVSGWRAFEDELPKANELILIVWPSGRFEPELRTLTNADLRNDWSDMRWCPVPAYR
jgi:hypothetical protein